MRIRGVVRTLVVASVLLWGASATADVVGGSDTGGRPLSAVLSGAAEVPGPGDTDGSGTADVTLNQGEARVCWEITWQDITEPPFAAHIHVAPAGVAGPVVVPLNPIAGGCTTADPDLIKAIRQDPAAYYVNVHTTDFPGGAIRGQLSR